MTITFDVVDPSVLSIAILVISLLGDSIANASLENCGSVLVTICVLRFQGGGDNGSTCHYHLETQTKIGEERSAPERLPLYVRLRSEGTRTGSALRIAGE